MAKKSNVIEINSRKYDASTGELLIGQSPPKTATSSQMIDGFAKVSTSRPKPPQPVKILTLKEVKREVRRRAKHAQELHRPASKSKTLIRSLTKRPNKDLFRTKIITSATAFTKNNDASPKNKLAAVASPKRLEQARASKQSSAITKFAGSKIISKPTNNQPVSPATKTPPLSAKEQLIAKQMAKVGTLTPKKPKKSRKNPIKNAANSVKKSPKITTIVALLLTALMLFGYITYLNIPNMSLRVAAANAGFSASMPGFSPDGYRFTGPIAHSPGQITIQFSSNTDDRSFNITQRQTSWDSKSLLYNFVRVETGSDSQYSVFFDRGLTVYIYGDSNATWVNGGIWYTISGDSLLSSDHLLRIAASL